MLDTNVISELMKSRPEAAVISWVDSQTPSILYISAIARAEIELGIALLAAGRRKKDLAASADLLFSEFSGRCLAFDSAAAPEYAGIVSQRNKMGRPISVEDAQIAAIARANSMRLATRNIVDFEFIQRLEIINPWKKK
ncbi:MAG: type II toxin-antitoxin system VapC family toxin [Thermodesulfobacteriota bacterium]